MIQNAKDTPLDENPGTLPNMAEALLEWFQPMTFHVLTKDIVEFQVVETAVEVQTKGVRQPLSPGKLMVKPELQRAWSWEEIHCLPDVAIKVDDVVVYRRVKYRVMNKYDYPEYGYVRLETVLAYQAAGG